jgi:hypothetical protein
MNTKRFVLSIIGVGALAAVSYLAGRARAGGIPQAGAMTYAGVLQTAAGVPVAGSHTVNVTLWTSLTAGTMACADTGAKVLVLPADGTFEFPLGDDCTAAVHANQDLFVEVTADSQQMPRTKLGAVP